MENFLYMQIYNNMFETCREKIDDREFGEDHEDIDKHNNYMRACYIKYFRAYKEAEKMATTYYKDLGKM